MKYDQCRGCGADVRWFRTTSGKWMIVDAEPSATGNVVVNDDGTVEVSRFFGDGRTRYVPHWGTCPNANDFRRT